MPKFEIYCMQSAMYKYSIWDQVLLISHRSDETFSLLSLI